MLPRNAGGAVRVAGDPDARVHVRTSGSGPEVFVLIHGIGVSSRYFGPLATELARSATVHNIDLPGHGSVPKPPHALSVPQYAAAVWAALDELGVRHPILVGHSMGAQIAVQMATEQCETMRGAPGRAPRGVPSAVPEGKPGRALDGTTEGPVGAPADVRRRPAAVVLLGPTSYPAERGFWRQAMRLAQDTLREPAPVNWITFSDYAFRCGLAWYLRTVPAMLASHIEDRIGQIQVPVAVVRGASDPIVPAAWACAIAHLAPRGWTAEVGGEGHVLMYRSAVAVAALCRAAVARS